MILHSDPMACLMLQVMLQSGLIIKKLHFFIMK